GLKVAIDIRVVEFNRRNDQIVWMVVKKFRPAIPESRFVFVTFKNHFAAIAEAVAPAKILCHTTDQKCRLFARHMKYPREHRRSRRFSVSSAHDNRMLSRQKELFQRLRQGAVRDLLFEDFFQLWISARDDIGNNDQIRLRLQMRSIKAMVVR